MQNEIWKSVSGYESVYEISNLGRVRSFAMKSGMRFLSVQSDLRYLYVGLWKKGKGRHYQIHRLIALAFIPNPLNLPIVNHRDGDKRNNSIENLEWVTDSQNKLHAASIGLFGGEKARTAKLNPQQVVEIRQSYPRISAIELARAYSIHDTTIYKIVKRKTWKYI